MNIILCICGFTFLHTLVLQESDVKVLMYNRWISFVLLVFLLVYIGTRPINGVFVDMTTYAQTFQQFKLGLIKPGKGDIGFEYFIYYCSQLTSVEMFFFICAFIYVVPLFIACKKWFPKHYFFAFLMLVASFSFWTYGTNGIRNGMATSLFIWALSYLPKNLKAAIPIFALSLMFHKSMLLPLLALGITFIMTDTKKYYFFWLFSIFLSITMGGIWESLFASMGFGDDRLAGYLTAAADAKKFSSTGFRYDFLLYSAAPLVLAYFYVFKKGFSDPLYKHILHTYMIANAFWIMVIRANFSNRFAYLSWFLMALVVVYPLLKEVFWHKQFKKLGIITLVYYGFTYAMYFYYEYR
tara:strand:- start:2489 stop:3547 length:1059 start_codon:yes stop_codon:yes gene_type:complete